MRHQLTHGWEMVTASTLPLLTLAIMTFLGAKLSTAVLGALVCTTVLLTRGRLVDRPRRPAVDR